MKKDLRRKLEENGGKVNLDSTSYPDINVITGMQELVVCLCLVNKVCQLVFF